MLTGEKNHDSLDLNVANQAGWVDGTPLLEHLGIDMTDSLFFSFISLHLMTKYLFVFFFFFGDRLFHL